MTMTTEWAVRTTEKDGHTRLTPYGDEHTARMIADACGRQGMASVLVSRTVTAWQEEAREQGTA